VPIFADRSQIMTASITVADGSTAEGVIVPIFIPLDEVPALLAAYDPSASSHPLASIAKPIAAPVLDALVDAVTGEP